MGLCAEVNRHRSVGLLYSCERCRSGEGQRGGMESGLNLLAPSYDSNDDVNVIFIVCRRVVALNRKSCGLTFKLTVCKS